MRGKSSSPKSRNAGLEPVEQKESHVSGAYIRNLVKQLSSSRTKDSSNFQGNGNLEGGGGISDQKPGNSDQVSQQQHKKARRRLHTSRPYQERLLNMAEARREIVTALKFHRAAMKQANDKQQQQQKLEPGPNIQPFGSVPHHLSLEEEEGNLNSGRNPILHVSNSSFPNNNCPISYNCSENFAYSQGLCSSYSWPVPLPILPPPLIQENLNFALPSQTLGLNLNLQDFNCIDSATFHCASNPSLVHSLSSASTSSSPFSATIEEIPTAVGADVLEFGDSGLHHAMDNKDMAEMRSIGEQYEVEWNDTLNLVNSAWWFEFLKSMETSSEGNKGEDFMNCMFEEAAEFPAWLNANEQHGDQSCPGNYFQDSALPCMDIEEVDGIDGDWLA